MLRFSTGRYRDVTFFDKDGEHMLAAMGCSGKVPGGLDAGGVSTALEALRKAVRVAEQRQADAGGEDEAEEEIVAPRSRAQPLLELLEAAARHEDFVTWERC